MYSTTSYKNASNIQDYNSKSDGLDQLKAQQPLQTQRSSNSNNTSNQRSIPYNSSKTNLAGSTRLQQIILTNQSSLNNIISELNLKRLPSASSLNTTSNTNYSNIFNGNESYSVLVKSPFKHYRNQNASNSRMNKSNASSKSNSVNDVNNSNLSTPKTDASSRNINYNQLESRASTNPSAKLIVKTASVINNYIDQFTKAKYINQVNYHNLNMRRSRKYSGLKPLNYVQDVGGPSINNCIGIIKESKNQTSAQLKEIYEYKLKLLEQKNQMQAAMYKKNKLSSAKSNKSKELSDIRVVSSSEDNYRTVSNLSIGSP